MADRVEIDPEDFTLDEIEEMEDLTGLKVGALFASASGIKAAFFITKRRDDPTFTWDDAGKVKVKEIDLRSSPDPTDAAVDWLDARRSLCVTASLYLKWGGCRFGTSRR